MCVAVIKTDRVSPPQSLQSTGRQPVTKHDSRDERRVPEFMGVQTRQQITTTKRDKGCETGRHCGS